MSALVSQHWTPKVAMIGKDQTSSTLLQRYLTAAFPLDWPTFFCLALDQLTPPLSLSHFLSSSTLQMKCVANGTSYPWGPPQADI